MPGQPLELCRLPWAIPSQDEPPNGARVGGQATVRGGRPLLLLLLPLGTLSAKNKLSENHISFWVKGEKCNISSKWEALRLPAPGISPRSFLPLGEAPQGGERRRGEVAESRGGESEGKASYCGPGAVGCVETSGPVCVGAAQDPKGADQEAKGK